MKKIIFLLAFSPLLFAASCKKDPPPEPEPELPPLTTTGEGTFGCYLNGEPWVAEWFLQAPGMPQYLEATYNEWTHNFSVAAIIPSDSIVIDKLLVFSIASPFKGGEYQFPKYRSQYEHRALCGFLPFTTDSLSKSNCQITKFDIRERIASGTFKTTLIQEDCPQDTIVIEEGRFDVKFIIVQ